MKINTDSKKIKELLGRGVKDVIEKKSVLRKLKSGKKLRIKHGIEPTGVNLHIGRAISYWKLKKFQELGHQIVIIIGDFTAQIGDASDKQAMRQPLTEKEIKTNMKNYEKQLGKILDMEKSELHYNTEWFNKFSMKEMFKLSMNFTAQQMIQRTNFKERWEQGRPIGVHELNYPLLQGYDSVAIKADIEVGGFDQLFNLLTGREVQKIYNQKPQDIITFNMLFGLDGRKMSTSWGNVINILDSPQEQYGKIMSMKDELIINYFELASRISLEEIEKIRQAMKVNRINPRDAKARLAREIVELYHGRQTALKAEKEFEQIFRQKKIPSKIPKVKIKEKSLNILDLLVKVKLVSSKSEAKRLILQKGVRIDKETQNNWQKAIEIKKGTIIQIGKRKFVKIII
ncbi:tyrosine--tRNA ligase [Candidatus Parcubacteria bacterium]|nr:tyrosine--tRNA ligase [Candidatus Parcubacteria bacterium]